MAKYTPSAEEDKIRSEGTVLELGSLVAAFGMLHDQRDGRGLRYHLATLLAFIMLAKLAGESSLRGIAQWVRLRATRLAAFMGFAKVQAPHATTFSRALASAIQIEEFERVSRDFFAHQPGAGTSVHITLDGKTLRGTIPAGQSQGIHLLAAFLPAEGWVLFQVEVGRKENEIPAAIRVVKTLDLRGKIVTGDALLAQRELSIEILHAGGDYLWIIKENQPETHQDIVRLFAPEPVVKGFSPASHDDFQTAETIEKAHGRIERRRLTASSALKGYLKWPGVEQVFELERQFTRVKDGHVMHEVVYGLTSLTTQEASPARLLELVREHWQIENGLHYRRDDTLKEDRCTVRREHAPEAMAVLNNIVLGLLLRRGIKLVPDARREFDGDPHQAWELIARRP
jgi:predicted transposase YbfD/YdcC